MYFKFSIAFLLCLWVTVSANSQAPQTAAPTPPAAAKPGAPVANFADIADKAGLIATNVFGGVDTKKYIIETTGTGVAIFDYDNDGWPDIFIVNGTTLEGFPPGKAPTNHLYHNNHDGTFTDVTVKAGLADATGWGQGVCVGDYDNDGYEDLYVTYYGKNRLYHNNHDGTFTEVGEKAGVSGNGKAWGTGCAFVDYNRDGHLGLMVANYVDFNIATTPVPGEGSSCVWKGVPVMCGPRGLPGAKNILYQNNGDGTFTDVTKKAHIDQTGGHYAFSVSTFDYDDDGWPDMYVACDSAPSILYHNNHDGTFTDVAVMSGVAFNEDGREQAGMGTSIADYNGDGRLDIFKTNFSDDTPDPLPQRRRRRLHRRHLRCRTWHPHAISWLGHDVFRFRQRLLAGHRPRQRPRLSRSRQIPSRRRLQRTTAALSQQRQRHVHRRERCRRSSV